MAKSLLYHLDSLIRIIFYFRGMYFEVLGYSARVFLLLYIMRRLMTVVSLMMDADIPSSSSFTLV
jgi:hypothetical protein